jgi:hypothetical protein
MSTRASGTYSFPPSPSTGSQKYATASGALAARIATSASTTARRKDGEPM